VTTQGATQLRPLGVGERIDAGIKLYVRSCRALAPALLVVAVPIALVDAALAAWTATTLRAHPFVVHNVDGSLSFHTGNLDRAIGAFVVTYAVTLALWVPGKAIAYRAFADTYLGRPSTWRSALSGGLRRVGSLYWIDLLTDAVFLAAIACFTAVAVALAPLHAVGIVLLLPTICLLFVFLVWWATSCRLVGPTLMLEDLRGWRTVRRSVTLVRGTWWSVFGTVLLSGLLFVIVSSVLNLVASAIVTLLVSSSNVGRHSFFVTLLQQLLSIVVFIPLTGAISTVLTVDMRVRKEGLDLAMLSDALDGTTAPGTYDFLPRPRMVYVPGQVPPPWPPPPPPSSEAP
jgi:hypothetical protein